MLSKISSLPLRYTTQHTCISPPLSSDMNISTTTTTTTTTITTPPSPEFAFWAASNHRHNHTNSLVSADELFVDGFLRPLHHLDPPKPPQQLSNTTNPPASITTTTTKISTPSTSKRWKDIFKLSDKKPPDDSKVDNHRKKSSGVVAEQLNINIWPFRRSRSAGSTTASTKPSTRKVSSAPCSRSNSRGETTVPVGRRWAASPGRPGGIPVGRASPVWQLRRGPVKAGELGRRFDMRSKQQKSRRVENGEGISGGEQNLKSSGGGGDKGLFSLRTLFSKKVM